MKAIWELLISLKTVFGLFALSIVICFIGSVMLPSHLAFFSGIDDTPLFRWLSEAGDKGLTWWIYALIVSIAGLAVSTVACTVDALIKSTGRTLLFRLSPQIMHAGVLFVMLAHLLTAGWGLREDVDIEKGERASMGRGVEVVLKDVGSGLDEEGYYTSWEAELEFYIDGKAIGADTLRPVEPVYAGGLGLFFKTFKEGGKGRPPAVVIRVVDDPGALWALLGGFLVTLGGVCFVWTRRPRGTGG
jgi:hypothetical protein